MDGLFFKGLNFTDDQHPRNSQNLRTLKKPTIQYHDTDKNDILTNSCEEHRKWSQHFIQKIKLFLLNRT